TDVQDPGGPDPKTPREQGGQQHTPKEAQPTDDALVEDNIEKDTFDPRVVTRATEKSGIANNPDTPMEVSGEAADHRTDAPVKHDLMERDRLALLAQQEFADSLKNQSLPTTDPTAIRQALAQGTDKTRAKKKHPGQIDQEKENALALGEQEVDPTGKKSIFEAIQEMEEEDKVATAEVSDRWSVGPSVAPVYFGTSGNGSPINSEFNTNSKTGNFNLSYGLNVAYEV